jgi:hypothetical protein
VAIIQMSNEKRRGLSMVKLAGGVNDGLRTATMEPAAAIRPGRVDNLKEI